MIILSNMSDIFLGTLSGVLITLVTAWLGIKVAVRLKLMDIPGALPRKQHQLPTPYAGGIALLLSLLVLLVGTGMWRSEELRGLFLAVLVIFVFGIWDDYKKLRPAVKFCGQLLAAFILIPLHGILGAVWSIIFSIAISCLMFYSLYRRNLRPCLIMPEPRLCRSDQSDVSLGVKRRL